MERTKPAATQPVQVRLPSELWKQVRMRALEEDLPAVRLVEQVLRDYLTKRKQKAEAR
jgi:predicted DNA binding CopG/RHH family protein